MVYNILSFRDNKWEAIDYDGYLEINLMKYEVNYDGIAYQIDSSEVNSHECTYEDLDNFYQ